MSYLMNLTLNKKPSAAVQELLKKLYEDKPSDKRGWKTYFDEWSLPEVMKDLEDGLPAAIAALDAQAKGFKPVAEGKETGYGVHFHYPDTEFWYQRQYTK